MPTTQQKTASKGNIKRAQAKWKSMSKRQHSLAQPEGRSRKRPGAGGGKFYQIEVRPKNEFITFKTQDVGEKSGLERIAGKRQSGSWDTVTWLVAKGDAHVNDHDQLVVDDPRAKTALKQIRGPIIRKKGDVFSARARKNIPEDTKPTPAQHRAQMANIKKARSARQKQINR